MVLCENSNRKIIPIASGKGGVGKSMLTANLGLLLGKAGWRTILVDLDMGGSNLHSCLGLKNKYLGLGNFVSDRNLPFKDIILRTDYPSLFFVPGDVLVPGTADMVYGQKKTIVSNLLKLDADYILLDLGSGSQHNVIDFFLISNSGILVVMPQVTSILNAYSFLKNTLFRFLQRAFASQTRVSEYLKNVQKEPKPNSLPPFGKILREVDKISKASGKQMREYVAMLKPSIVVNMAESPEDLNIVESFRGLVQKNLELDLGCLGVVYQDKNIDKALKDLKPFVLHYPESIAAKEFQRLSDKLVQSRNFPAMPLDLNLYKDSFELAQIEAQYDYSELEAGPDPEGKGVQDMGPDEFLAVLTAQQKKISELQSTIRMLTLRGGSPS